MGSREKLLNRKLEDMTVIRQAYHGNVFVGNHCKLVLNKYKTLCNVVADKPDFHHKINTVFGIFSKICPLLFLKSRHLTSDEIASIKQLCIEFGEVFPVVFPECNVTRKIHELIFTVPRFVSEFRTIGMMSEEEGESIQASVNSELRQLFSVREPAKKLSLILKCQELRSKAPNLSLHASLGSAHFVKISDNCEYFFVKGRIENVIAPNVILRCSILSIYIIIH